MTVGAIAEFSLVNSPTNRWIVTTLFLPTGILQGKAHQVIPREKKVYKFSLVLVY